MSRSVFISRDLPQSSSLLLALTDAGITVKASSLIRIVPLDLNIDTSRAEWIFLSSANGARILLSKFSPPADVSIAVVGAATEKAVRQFGLSPSFIGLTGDTMQIGKAFHETVGKARVLFAGAEDGSDRVRRTFPQSQVDVVPIYRTEALQDPFIPVTDIAFLTSPSNADVYLRHASSISSVIAAIGNTTADFLKQSGIKDVAVSRTPKEADVIELLTSL